MLQERGENSLLQKGRALKERQGFLVSSRASLLVLLVRLPWLGLLGGSREEVYKRVPNAWKRYGVQCR